jgi:hypothetical protein
MTNLIAKPIKLKYKLKLKSIRKHKTIRKLIILNENRVVIYSIAKKTNSKVKKILKKIKLHSTLSCHAFRFKSEFNRIQFLRRIFLFKITAPVVQKKQTNSHVLTNNFDDLFTNEDNNTYDFGSLNVDLTTKNIPLNIHMPEQIPFILPSESFLNLTSSYFFQNPSQELSSAILRKMYSFTESMELSNFIFNRYNLLPPTSLNQIKFEDIMENETSSSFNFINQQAFSSPNDLSRFNFAPFINDYLIDSDDNDDLIIHKIKFKPGYRRI